MPIQHRHSYLAGRMALDPEHPSRVLSLLCWEISLSTIAAGSRLPIARNLNHRARFSCAYVHLLCMNQLCGPRDGPLFFCSLLRVEPSAIRRALAGCTPGAVSTPRNESESC